MLQGKGKIFQKPACVLYQLPPNKSTNWIGCIWSTKFHMALINDSRGKTSLSFGRDKPWVFFLPTPSERKMTSLILHTMTSLLLKLTAFCQHPPPLPLGCVHPYSILPWPPFPFQGLWKCAIIDNQKACNKDNEMSHLTLNYFFRRKISLPTSERKGKPGHKHSSLLKVPRQDQL